MFCLCLPIQCLLYIKPQILLYSHMFIYKVRASPLHTILQHLGCPQSQNGCSFALEQCKTLQSQTQESAIAPHKTTSVILAQQQTIVYFFQLHA